jgi:hypothetical protein
MAGVLFSALGIMMLKRWQSQICIPLH